MQDFMLYLFSGLTRGSMYALIALGYTLVYGVLQLINFAHSEVFMSGAFVSFIVVPAVVGDGRDARLGGPADLRARPGHRRPDRRLQSPGAWSGSPTGRCDDAVPPNSPS